MEGGGQRGRLRVRGVGGGRTRSSVGVAGRVQRRRGLLAMRDPRTERQGLAGLGHRGCWEGLG